MEWAAYAGTPRTRRSVNVQSAADRATTSSNYSYSTPLSILIISRIIRITAAAEVGGRYLMGDCCTAKGVSTGEQVITISLIGWLWQVIIAGKKVITGGTPSGNAILTNWELAAFFDGDTVGAIFDVLHGNITKIHVLYRRPGKLIDQ